MLYRFFENLLEITAIHYFHLVISAYDLLFFLSMEHEPLTAIHFYLYGKFIFLFAKV